MLSAIGDSSHMYPRLANVRLVFLRVAEPFPRLLRVNRRACMRLSCSSHVAAGKKLKRYGCRLLLQRIPDAARRNVVCNGTVGAKSASRFQGLRKCSIACGDRGIAACRRAVRGDRQARHREQREYREFVAGRDEQTGSGRRQESSLG